MKYVSGMRVVRGDNLVRGARVGEVLVDFAQVGVCDRHAAEQAFDRLGDAGMQFYHDQLQTTDLVKVVTLPNDVEMFMPDRDLATGTILFTSLAPLPSFRRASR